MANGDVLINIIANNKQFNQALQGTKKQLNAFSSAVQGAMSNVKKAMQSVSQGVMNVRDNYQKAMKDSSKAVGKTTDQINRQRKGFPAWALSIMFFGMMLKRVFDTIWRSSTQTFRDVMNSVEGTTNAFDKLEGAMTWLKFIAGQALEPLAEAFIPIILAIADWISENEELFRNLVLITGIVGVLFLGIGQLALGFAAIKSLLTTAIIPIFKGIGVLLSAKILPIILILAAVALVLYAAWKENFLGIQQIVGNVFETVWGIIKDVVKFIVVLFQDLIRFFRALFRGDFKEAFGIFINIARNTFITLARLIIRLVGLTVNNTIALWNSLVGATRKVARLMMQNLIDILLKPAETLVNNLASILSRLPGGPPKWITNIQRGMSNVRKTAEDMADSVADSIKEVDKIDINPLLDRVGEVQSFNSLTGRQSESKGILDSIVGAGKNLFNPSQGGSSTTIDNSVNNISIDSTMSGSPEFKEFLEAYRRAV